MPVKVVDRTQQAFGEMKQQVSLGLRFMIDDIDRKSIPNTPKLTGDLRNRKLKQVLGLTARIGWITNYAVFQELKQFTNYTTPGTGPHFAEKAVKEVVNAPQVYFDRAGIR